MGKLMSKPIVDFPRLRITGVFLAWAGAYVWLLMGRHYQMFLRPGFWVLLLLALGIILVFLAAVIIRPGHAEHVTQSAALWIKTGLLLLPLFYLLAAQDETLKSHAFKTRSTAQSFPFEPGSAKVPNETRKEGELTLLEILADFDKYKGKRVITKGMVFRDDTVPEKHFVVFRFVIVCCAADAMPAGILLAHTHADSFEEDSWVRVEGTIGLKKVEDVDYPYMEAENIVAIDPLKNPYLYPQFF